MKIKDLIAQLETYNSNAEISVVAHCKIYPFSITYGGQEGVTTQSTTDVHIYVDQLCTNEQQSQ